MFRHLAFSIFLLSFFQSNAQIPANDNCTGATFIYLDQTGNTCINDSNIMATGDGLSNACDAGATPPLPAGGNEVWYSYVVNGTVNTISVTPLGSNPAQKVSVTVINGNCAGGGSTNVCNTALTNFDPASIAFTSFAGTQIWFYVTSLETDGEFLVCISSTNGFINPGIRMTLAVQARRNPVFLSLLLVSILRLFVPSGISLLPDFQDRLNSLHSLLILVDFVGPCMMSLQVVRDLNLHVIRCMIHCFPSGCHHR